MTALLFPNEEALRVALTSGLVPPEMQAAAVSVARLDDGALRIFPSVPLSETAAKGLRTAGISVEAVRLSGAVHVSCWAQAIAPRWLGEPEQVPGLVLFAVPRGESALHLAGELLRLGCDRQEYRFTPDDPQVAAWVRVVHPPYYTVARILDRSTGTRAFIPSPPGQDRVWTQLGFQHPLAHLVKPGGGELLLINDDGSWTRLSDERWTDIYQLIDVALPAPNAVLASSRPTERLTVPLRLSRSTRQQAPTFWVLRASAASELDALVQHLPDNVLDRLQFAASGELVILRVRAGVDSPPELVLPAEAYVPLAGFQNLFIPGERLVEPPLRRDRLRELLAPDPEQVYWLAPLEGTSFRVESIAATAFAPLSEWVEYVVHSQAAALEPWVRAATFEFEAFESIGGEWGAAPLEPEQPEAPAPETRSGRKRKTVTDTPIIATSSAAKPKHPVQVSLLEAVPQGTFSATAEEQRLAGLERAFLDSPAPADDPSRQTLWLAMAQSHTRLKRAREAGLCWTRTIWELDGDEAGPVLKQWAQAEGQLVGAPAGNLLPTLLARTTPSKDETRALAAQVAWAVQDSAAASTLDAHAVQVWLDAHDENLDVRSLWLARAALARHVGGDRLGLARAHDRVLARLQRGLSLERDVPAFLRFSSRATGDMAGAGQLAEGLEALLKKFETTKRRRSAIEARPELTRAYVLFLFAYGLARLGQAERARALRTMGAEALDKKDKVHSFLARAYSARIDQALEGLPLETPLPAALAAELNTLDRSARYVIDQLRRASTILESHETLDPIEAWIRGEADSRGAEFAGLRGLSDTERLGNELERLAKVAAAATGTDRRRLFEGVIDFLPSLPEARAVSQLQLLSRGLEPFDPKTRALVIEKLLLMCGFFARRELAQPLAVELTALVPQFPADGVTEVASTMGRCIRSLRRVGLRESAGTLIEQLLGRLAGNTPATLASRVQLAGGLASIGRLEAAQPSFDAALAVLRGELKIDDRRTLARAYCTAVGQTNPGYALARVPMVAERLVDVTDNLSTYQYFCLSVVHFMESLVLGLASEDLELGEAGRRWLDEDEYLVRRRVHRELRKQG